MFRSACVSMTLASLLAAPASASWLFHDGDFNDGSWGHSIYTFGGDQMGTVDIVENGGAPGGWLRYTAHLESPNGQGGYGIRGISTSTNAVYDPGTEGAINSVAFSITTKESGFYVSDWVFGRLVAVQDGQMYIAGSAEITDDVNSWSIVNRDSITADDFHSWVPEGNTWDLDSHPDFSAGGSEITFGFMASLFNVETLISRGYDNFSVRIDNGVPAPGPAALAACGLAFGARRRR